MKIPKHIDAIQLASPKKSAEKLRVHWLLNIVLYQAIWLICIVWENQVIWLACPILVFHFIFSPCKKEDLLLMLSVLVVGMCVDGVLKFVGFFSFSSDAFPIPLWLTVIWLSLATLPNHSLHWLKNKPLLSGTLAAAGGPLAYWAGVRFGVATFHLPLAWSLLILAVVWGLLFPFIMAISSILSDQIPPPPSGEITS